MENQGTDWHKRRDFIIPILVGIMVGILPTAVPMNWIWMLVCWLVLGVCIVWLILIVFSSKTLRNGILIISGIMLIIGGFYRVQEQWLKDHPFKQAEKTIKAPPEIIIQSKEPTAKEIAEELAKISEPDVRLLGAVVVGVWTKKENIEGIFQGISLIVRVQNKGSRSGYVTGADIRGKIFLSYEEYWPLVRQKGDARPPDLIRSEFDMLKPYRKIIFRGMAYGPQKLSAYRAIRRIICQIHLRGARPHVGHCNVLRINL